MEDLLGISRIIINFCANSKRYKASIGGLYAGICHLSIRLTNGKKSHNLPMVYIFAKFYGRQPNESLFFCAPRQKNGRLGWETLWNL